MATAVKSRLKQVFIREERVSGYISDLHEPRVDRKRGIIHGVKVVGRSSPNTHGVRGVDGTEYTMEALANAAPLYEGINVNVDHPPRQNPDKERSANDRFAWLEGIRVTEEGLYGDLHFLDPADPLAVKMMNAAENKPNAYALSHNAMGKGEIRDGKYVVTEIPEVRSVDIVADGGTNRSLFESNAMKVKVCEVLRDKVLPALKAGRKKRLETLLRTSLSEDRSPLMEAEEDGKDHRDHMYTAMRACEDAGNEEAAGGIHKLLHPEKRIEEEESEASKEKEEEEEDGESDERSEMEGMGEEGPGEGGANNEGPDGKGGPGTAWESRRRKKAKTTAGEVHLTESRATAMCRAAGIEATADVVEAMRGADFDQALRILNLAKRSQAPARQASPPRSTSRVSITEQVAPSASDVKGWMARLRS